MVLLDNGRDFGAYPPAYALSFVCVVSADVALSSMRRGAHGVAANSHRHFKMRMRIACRPHYLDDNRLTVWRSSHLSSQREHAGRHPTANPDRRHNAEPATDRIAR